MKALLIWMIRFYRREISPARPPCCRFIPTCSAYALEAVEKYGALKGWPCAAFCGATPSTGRSPSSTTPCRRTRPDSIYNVEVPLWVLF